MSPTKRTVSLISGSNQGIGLAVATQLAKDHGYHVIIGSRNGSAGEQAASSLVAEGLSASSVQLDITSDESIAAAVSSIKQDFGVLDILVNNAGILIDYVPGLTDESKDLSTRELFTRTMNTNVIGTACLTEACLPLLRKSSFPRLVFVTSRMGSLAESLNTTTMYYNMDYKAYDCSKAAMNMLAINYRRILAENGASVNVACPGLIKSNLTKHLMGESTEVGAQRIVELATVAKDEAPHATFSDRHGNIAW